MIENIRIKTHLTHFFTNVFQSIQVKEGFIPIAQLELELGYESISKFYKLSLEKTFKENVCTLAPKSCF